MKLPTAPGEGDLSICPHCWYVNAYATRLCLRCLADMTTLLQESGGLRMTAAVQSPMPVRASSRLSPVQRGVVFGFVVLLVIAQLGAAFAPHLLRRAPLAPIPIGGSGTVGAGTGNHGSTH